MKEKKELSDKDKQRISLINYFLKKDETLQFENLDTNSSNLQKGEKSSNPKEESWWYDKEQNIFNQKAHVIIRILSSNILRIPNKGFRLWFALAFLEENKSLNSDEKIKLLQEKILKETVSLSSYSKELNIDNLLSKNTYDNINIDLLLKYVSLYFNNINNFNKYNNKLDYDNLNKPILDNLYDWYLKDISQDKIQECCDKLEEIVSDMENLLFNNFENIIKKYNLICTICHTKVIINNLREKQGISKKENIENDNNYLKMIIENLKITDQVIIK
ncbi:hypothetical protein [Faecalibacillus faecis]|uniref:hypothetical protein n=1 Tax=Faecalibacillus faecis TaxID=1982628 RepID=UPI0022E490EA|nr:hypothetical protein [Faecalibacillus faecis]